MIEIHAKNRIPSHKNHPIVTNYCTVRIKQVQKQFDLTVEIKPLHLMQ